MKLKEKKLILIINDCHFNHTIISILKVEKREKCKLSGQKLVKLVKLNLIFKRTNEESKLCEEKP